jgi:hypothetical protein
MYACCSVLASALPLHICFMSQFLLLTFKKTQQRRVTERHGRRLTLTYDTKTEFTHAIFFSRISTISTLPDVYSPILVQTRFSRTTDIIRIPTQAIPTQINATVTPQHLSLPLEHADVAYPRSIQVLLQRPSPRDNALFSRDDTYIVLFSNSYGQIE